MGSRFGNFRTCLPEFRAYQVSPSSARAALAEDEYCASRRVGRICFDRGDSGSVTRLLRNGAFVFDRSVLFHRWFIANSCLIVFPGQSKI